ncbi:MAG: YdeI/OmpD-associated family protein [Candidatus Diapherotrites archaeon]
MPEITETQYFTNRKEWRKWLRKNHAKKKEVWLIYYKVSSCKPRIPYDDAVEEAICFGWIDSIVKSIDDEKYCQRYTPRNKKSIWSELNLERVKKMIKQKKMTKIGFEKLGNALETGPSIKRITPKVPADLEKALSKNKKALGNFEKFAPSNKRHYIWWIEEAKRPETRERRIKRVIGFSKENKKLGEM